jgi:hypothetical protein
MNNKEVLQIGFVTSTPQIQINYYYEKLYAKNEARYREARLFSITTIG